MAEVRICPECNGAKIVEHESARPVATPEGPRWQTWLDCCQLCGGDGVIKVESVEMEDICGDA